MFRNNILNGLNSESSATYIVCSVDDLRTIVSEQIQLAKRETEREIENKGLSGHYSTEEVKNLLHISTPTLWRYSKAGLLASIYVGGKKYFSRESVNALINNGK